MIPRTKTFPSRSGGRPHVVERIDVNETDWYVTCSCPGGRFAWANRSDPGRGCWAMVDYRRLVEADTASMPAAKIETARELEVLDRELDVMLASARKAPKDIFDAVPDFEPLPEPSTFVLAGVRVSK